MPLFNRNQGKILGKKTDATAVDKGEIKSSYASINTELGGSLNPVRGLINLAKRLFGNSRQDRIQGQLGQLKEYSSLYDNYLFANDSLKFLKTKLHQQISKKEGILSKLGLMQSKKVLADPVISELKSTFKSWLVPFEQILSGGVKGVSLYQADIDFLRSLSADLINGNHSEYLKDLSGDVNRVLSKVLKQQQQAQQPRAQQPNAQAPRSPQTSRQQAQQLASLAA